MKKKSKTSFGRIENMNKIFHLFTWLRISKTCLNSLDILPNLDCSETTTLLECDKRCL